MLREWLITNAEIVTKVAVGLIYIIAGLVAWVIVAGLWIAFRPEGGYAVEILAAALAVTYLHVSRAGQPGRHRATLAA